MNERFSVGIDWTTGPATLYLKTPDGKIHRFQSPHEAAHLFLEGQSCAVRHFLHPLTNPGVLRPDDRQKK